MKSSYPLLIIGAGAAGIGAAHAARQAGLDYLVVEAAHRVGGRGLTEELAPGIPWDLGCHWLHSGSINPLASVADKLGFHYDKGEPTRGFYLHGSRISAQQQLDYENYCDAVFDHNSQWAPYYAYWQSLMFSSDIDCFSALELVRYEDTGEDWPVREGYGKLLEKHAENLNIALNTVVKRIDSSAQQIQVDTSQGSLRADCVVVTVSTGVLGAQDIEFLPALPIEKQEAISALPLGCYNNFAMLYDEPWPFCSDTPERIDFSDGDDINFAFKLRCSDWPYIYCAIAGRQAQWFENQPIEASQDFMMSALCTIFGSDFKRKMSRFRVSAWGNDAFVKGAYSASKPGCAHLRSVLAQPIDKRLYFAGEAASERAYCTAHGAWQSGRDAVNSYVS